MTRFLIAASLLMPLALFAADKKPVAPKAGIKTPGVQIPIASLKAEAEIPSAPTWVGIADMLLLPNATTLDRLDPKSNKLDKPVAGVNQPCGGTVTAFTSIWALSCGDQTLLRIDPKKWEITTTIPTGTGTARASHPQQSIAASADSVWVFTDNSTTLSRVDPDTNKIVGEIRLPAGCTMLAFGETALWATCPSEDRVLRINPLTYLVEKRIEVSARPRALALGEGSIWVICEKDGKVDRIDPKTNKVSKSIELLIPSSGETSSGIAVGQGSVWVTQEGFPLTRIDPLSEKVAQQFWGPGGGAIQFGANALWLSNLREKTLWRIDPKRVLATLAE